MSFHESIENQLTRYYELWRKSNAAYEEWAKTQGLSSNSLIVLYSFYVEQGKCTQKEISQRWFIPKQTVNTILKEFEKQGYITLSPMPTDKRNKRIELTPEGKTFADTIINKLHSKELYVMEEMGLEAIKGMNEGLSVYLKLFEEKEVPSDSYVD